mgnify:CR=1 FL=1
MSRSAPEQRAAAAPREEAAALALREAAVLLAPVARWLLRSGVSYGAFAGMLKPFFPTQGGSGGGVNLGSILGE